MKQSIHAYDRNGKELKNGLGICGGHADLCSHCSDHGYRALWHWTESQPDPIQGETLSEYWRRINGKFLDAWYSCSARKFRETGIAF